MLFTSTSFLLFFPILVVMYFIIPNRLKYLWLLISSYYFYMTWNPKYVILLVITTVTTYLGGILIKKSKKNKKIWLIISITINLGILIFFKYFDFILKNINMMFNKLNIELINKNFDILLPVGISFYTFQGLSYVIDVYREDVKVEKNIFRYALFVGFFPQLLAGPIQKSKDILEEFNNNHTFNYERIKNGLTRMLWGFFQKLVIADRLSIFVNNAYDNYESYSGLIMIIATVLFAVQIYCDFNSYSDIAIGAAEVLGFKLCENFRTPYFSKTIIEFWRRWHISLTSWFRDYLYIPLGGSRVSKIKKYRNIMIVFITSGLWHGAGWNFIIWGVLHGLYEIMSLQTKAIRESVIHKLGIKEGNPIYQIYQRIFIFIIVAFTWIFFKAKSYIQAITIVKSLFIINPEVLVDGTLFTLGLSGKEFLVAIIAVGILIIIDLLRRSNIGEGKNIMPTWATIMILYSILIFGVYGLGYEAQQFIYLQF